MLVLLAAIVFALAANHPAPLAFAALGLALIVAGAIWT
jgi:hypothetical protein